jgi:hypothetical protein
MQSSSEFLDYTPFTEAELESFGLLPKGDYKFKVLECTQGTSKGGFDKDGNQKRIYKMLTVKILIDNNGENIVLKDWVLLISDKERMGFKFRHFAATCGLEQEYMDKKLKASDFLGKVGTVKVVLKESSDEYGTKFKQNSIQDYVKPLNASDASNASDFKDDDINF